MKPDDIEQRLREQPLRQIPAGWRSEILSAASQPARPRPSALDTRPTSWWRELLWPSPWAWGSAAAAWGLICGLNFAASYGTEGASIAGSGPIPASVIRMAWAERQQFMASLLDVSSLNPAAPPRETTRPRPRSERKAEWFCA